MNHRPLCSTMVGKEVLLSTWASLFETLGPYATDEDLCLSEFSKSLCDWAYTWFIGLKPGLIRTWDDMVDVFCTKYFHGEETVTLVTLQATKQRNGEDSMEYIKRFRGITLQIHEERTLVEMCMTNMIRGYREVLENLEISQFAQLLQKAKKMAQFWQKKCSTGYSSIHWWMKKENWWNGI